MLTNSPAIIRYGSLVVVSIIFLVYRPKPHGYGDLWLEGASTGIVFPSPIPKNPVGMRVVEYLDFDGRKGLFEAPTRSKCQCLQGIQD